MAIEKQGLRGERGERNSLEFVVLAGTYITVSVHETTKDDKHSDKMHPDRVTPTSTWVFLSDSPHSQVQVHDQ